MRLKLIGFSLLLALLAGNVRAEFVPWGLWQKSVPVVYSTWTNAYMSYRTLWHDYQSNSTTIAYDHNPNFPLDATNLPAGSEPVATIVGTNALGVVDYAYLFDGVNDFQKMALSWGLSPGTNDITISVWCKPLVLNTNAAWLFHDYGTASTVSWGFGISDVTTNFFAVFRDDDSDICRAVGTSVASTGAWYHVVATRSNTTVCLYVNGLLEVTTNNANLDNVYSLPSPNPSIGAFNSGTAYFFSGIVDNLFVYPGLIMTLTDVTNEYAKTDHSGITGIGEMEDKSRNFFDFSTPTIGLNMRTVSEPEISDYSGNGNTATNINSAVRKNEGTNENGAICYSYYFNPTLTQYISGNSAVTEVQAMDSATITAWVNVTNFANFATIACASDSGTLRDFVLLQVDPTTAGSINFQIRQEGTIRISANTVDHFLKSNQWHHVALIMGNAGNRLLIDGEGASLSYGTGSTTNTYCFNDISDIDDLSLGSRFQNSVRDSYFVGGMANMRIYPKTLKTWEIYQEYLWTKPSNDLQVYP